MESEICGKCKGRLVLEIIDKYNSELVCLNCGKVYYLESKPNIETPRKTPVPPSKPIYNKSQNTKDSWERYRRSSLYTEAHARHRKTQKYKDTQQRYKDKMKRFKKLTEELEGFNCPLKFYSKKSKYKPEKETCDYNEDSNDCNLGCIKE